MYQGWQEKENEDIKLARRAGYENAGLSWKDQGLSRTPRKRPAPAAPSRIVRTSSDVLTIYDRDARRTLEGTRTSIIENLLEVYQRFAVRPSREDMKYIVSCIKEAHSGLALQTLVFSLQTVDPNAYHHLAQWLYQDLDDVTSMEL